MEDIQCNSTFRSRTTYTFNYLVPCQNAARITLVIEWVLFTLNVPGDSLDFPFRKPKTWDPTHGEPWPGLVCTRSTISLISESDSLDERRERYLTLMRLGFPLFMILREAESPSPLVEVRPILSSTKEPPSILRHKLKQEETLTWVITPKFRLSALLVSFWQRLRYIHIFSHSIRIGQNRIRHTILA